LSTDSHIVARIEGQLRATAIAVLKPVIGSHHRADALEALSAEATQPSCSFHGMSHMT
jgi:hypothetical protein